MIITSYINFFEYILRDYTYFSYEEEKREMEAMQDKFDEQEDEYDTLMEEKEQVERKIYEEKAYKFLMNRSARRIQRYWRAYKERKLARKRARKGIVTFVFEKYNWISVGEKIGAELLLQMISLFLK